MVYVLLSGTLPELEICVAVHNYITELTDKASAVGIRGMKTRTENCHIFRMATVTKTNSIV